MIFSQGTINTPSIDPSWANLLVMTFWRDEETYEKTAAERRDAPGLITSSSTR